jgi:hypothetical protein
MATIMRNIRMTVDSGDYLIGPLIDRLRFHRLVEK